MSGTNDEWVWDAYRNQHRCYLPDEGNWLYANGYVLNSSGATVRVVDMSGLKQQPGGATTSYSGAGTEQTNRLSGGSVQEVTSQLSALSITQGTTPYAASNLGTVPEQSHVTTSAAVYPQANASYAVGPYWDPNATTGYQISQYNGPRPSYGASSYYSNSNYPYGASNAGNYYASNSGTATGVPYAVGQPAATLPWGGVEKFFQNPELVTDSDLLSKGIRSYRKFGGPVASSYQLDPAYQVPKDGRSFFVFGKVFTTMWAEMQGSTVPTDQPTVVTEGENIWVKIRWFVVVRPGRDRSCTCLPIQTYQGRGVGKPRTVKSEHAIIYSTKKPPAPRSDEAPCRLEDGTIELDMLEPIRVVSKHRTEELDPMSRINFVRLYTVEHNTKVKEFGYVHRDYEHLLEKQFYQCWGLGYGRR